MQDDEVLAWLQAQAGQARVRFGVHRGFGAGRRRPPRLERATSHWASRDLLLGVRRHSTAGRVVPDGTVFTGGGGPRGSISHPTMVAELAGQYNAPAPPFDAGTPEEGAPPEVARRATGAHLVPRVRRSSLARRALFA